MKRLLIEAAALIIAAAVLFALCYANRELRSERDRYRQNTEALIQDVERYRVNDSLQAVRVQALSLTVAEFERFRATDAALIKQLKRKCTDLEHAATMQAATIMKLQAIPRDTVVIRDSVAVQARAVAYSDRWVDFAGIITPGRFDADITVRDSLTIISAVKYRRFLGFLWKTKKVQYREASAVSKCPYTKIEGIEFVEIEK